MSKKKAVMVALAAGAGLMIAACGNTAPPSASVTTTTTAPATTSTTTAPPPTTAPSAESSAQVACNGYGDFLSRFPDYLHNQAKAIATVETWSSAANAADQSNPAYHQLATNVSAFLAYASAPGWPQNATPADAQFTAIEDACSALSSRGLV